MCQHRIFHVDIEFLCLHRIFIIYKHHLKNHSMALMGFISLEFNVMVVVDIIQVLTTPFCHG